MNTDDIFKAAKVIKSFCSRVQSFSKLINEDRIQLAEIKPSLEDRINSYGQKRKQHVFCYYSNRY